MDRLEILNAVVQGLGLSEEELDIFYLLNAQGILREVTDTTVVSGEQIRVDLSALYGGN